MVDYTLRMDRRETEMVNRALDAVFARTSWSASQAVAKAGYMLSRSAAAFCKPGERYHQVVRNPDLTSQYPYMAVHLSPIAGQLPKLVGLPLVYSREQTAIRNRGFARMSWKLAEARVNRKRAKVPSAYRGSMRAIASLIYVHRSGGRVNPTIKIMNRVAYMNTAYPGVVPHAVRAGMTALVATFDKELARELKQAWA